MGAERTDRLTFASMSRSKWWGMPFVVLVGCASATPPPRWAEGGARLELPSATGSLGERALAIHPKGTWAEVRVDGEVALVLDAVGRIYDERKRPLAVLGLDGAIAGCDDALLGLTGSVHAAPAWQASAWLSVLPDGQIVSYDERGQGELVGRWSGCGGSASSNQACVLATHLLRLRDEGARRAPSPVSPQMGVGVIVAR
jgi:hypothetical protein